MAALFSTVSMLLSILFAVVVAVYFVQPLRVKAYRLFVKCEESFCSISDF